MELDLYLVYIVSCISVILFKRKHSILCDSSKNKDNGSTGSATHVGVARERQKSRVCVAWKRSRATFRPCTPHRNNVQQLISNTNQYHAVQTMD